MDRSSLLLEVRVLVTILLKLGGHLLLLMLLLVHSLREHLHARLVLRYMEV